MPNFAKTFRGQAMSTPSPSPLLTGYTADRALSLRNASPVYYHIDRDGVDVLDPATGKIFRLTKKQFDAAYVKSWLVPEHMRTRLDDIPSFREWRMHRGKA